MVLITEELVRKKAEHNECIIGTLEELSLHQEDIEKIEHLNNWCKELQILYLQANQISKIENLNKLKKLQYLNLAINNIETIENLERCESLEKLDLTLNFIGDIESVKHLKQNIFLKDLYLTGNPCAEFKYYREYVVAHLPQLECLDIQPITKAERIKASQNLKHIEESIKRDIRNNKYFREEQKRRLSLINNSHLTDEQFWQSVSEHSPETRLEISRRQQNSKKHAKNNEDHEKPPVQNVKLFTKEGRPLNVNQAKLDFHFNDEHPEKYVLDVALYKFLDTNLVEVDLQPIYVKLTIKGKIFQIVFPEEIQVDKSVAQRSQTTGHLVLTLPKLNHIFYVCKKQPKTVDNHDKNARSEKTGLETRNSTEFLEVTGKKNDEMDFSKIVEDGRKSKEIKFEDNAEVPSLEYG